MWVTWLGDKIISCRQHQCQLTIRVYNQTFPLWQSVLDLHFRFNFGFLRCEHFSMGNFACVCLSWHTADLTWWPIPHFVLQSVQLVLLHFGQGWVALHFLLIFGLVNFFCLKQFFGLTLYFPLKQTIFRVWCPIPQETSHGFQPRGSHRKTHWSQIVKSTGRFAASQNESGTLFVTRKKDIKHDLAFDIAHLVRRHLV